MRCTAWFLLCAAIPADFVHRPGGDGATGLELCRVSPTFRPRRDAGGKGGNAWRGRSGPAEYSVTRGTQSASTRLSSMRPSRPAYPRDPMIPSTLVSSHKECFGPPGTLTVAPRPERWFVGPPGPISVPGCARGPTILRCLSQLFSATRIHSRGVVPVGPSNMRSRGPQSQRSDSAPSPPRVPSFAAVAIGFAATPQKDPPGNRTGRRALPVNPRQSAVGAGFAPAAARTCRTTIEFLFPRWRARQPSTFYSAQAPRWRSLHPGLHWLASPAAGLGAKPTIFERSGGFSSARAARGWCIPRTAISFSPAALRFSYYGSVPCAPGAWVPGHCRAQMRSKARGASPSAP